MQFKAPFLREVEMKEVPESMRQAYPFSLPILRSSALPLRFDAPVTFFVGENGSGKSTVMEAIALQCGFNPAGGSRNNTYTHVATESPLSQFLKLVWNFKMSQGFFLRAESFFNFSTHLDELQRDEGGVGAYEPYGGASLHDMSHGESFMALFQHRFHRGIYLLDEPEAALSPQRQLSFLALLHERVRSGDAQFIIATHSPILLSYPGATIYAFGPEGIAQKRYEETEPYRITKDFLDSPGSFYRHLL